MVSNPVVVLEFNELTPSLIDRFIAEGHLPNFARLRSESLAFTTLTDERPPHLEPWIQWVTVHSGLPLSGHGLVHLNEGHKLKAKRTWEVVSDAGHPVWVCGSMNVPEANGVRGCVLPDPWCTKVKPTPSDLSSYFSFVQRNVLEHTNDRVPLGRSDYAAFLSFMLRRGLSLATVGAILTQLINERNGGARWKRAALLDLLQFDVFAHYYRRLTPAFSTFFLNSTAHYQHAYWDSMDPESFKTSSEGDRAKYRDAICYGYQRMDRLIGRFMKLASATNATLAFCTALSQQPSPDYDKKGAVVFYRPKDFAAFAKGIGLPGRFTAQPVMSEQFYLEFADASQAEAGAAHLRRVLVDGAPMLSVRQDGSRLFTGCNLHRDLADGTKMVIEGRELPFFSLLYRLDTGKTGVHHPDGILWVRRPDGTHRTFSERVPLTAVAPTFLQLLGLTPPSHMATAALPVG